MPRPRAPFLTLVLIRARPIPDRCVDTYDRTVENAPIPERVFSKSDDKAIGRLFPKRQSFSFALPPAFPSPARAARRVPRQGRERGVPSGEAARIVVRHKAMGRRWVMRRFAPEGATPSPGLRPPSPAGRGRGDFLAHVLTRDSGMALVKGKRLRFVENHEQVPRACLRSLRKAHNILIFKGNIHAGVTRDPGRLVNKPPARLLPRLPP